VLGGHLDSVEAGLAERPYDDEWKDSEVGVLGRPLNVLWDREPKWWAFYNLCVHMMIASADQLLSEIPSESLNVLLISLQAHDSSELRSCTCISPSHCRNPSSGVLHTRLGFLSCALLLTLGRYHSYSWALGFWEIASGLPASRNLLHPSFRSFGGLEQSGFRARHGRVFRH
jgi:hypothetical protein